MAVTVKLHSDATTARSDFTGEPSQVYENSSSAAWIITQIRAGNALTIFRVDNNCHWLHIVSPRIVNDIQDNPEWIVGNCSDVLGEYRLVKVRVSKLRYFGIMGDGNLLPVDPEVSESIEPSHLRRGPFADERDIKIASLPCYLVAFNGSKLPQGDVRSEESQADMVDMGPGYKIWYDWMIQFAGTEKNDVLQNTMEILRTAGTYERFVQPAGSLREFEHSPMGSVLQASASDYPEVAASIRRIFLEDHTRPEFLPPVPGAINVGKTTVVVKDARDEEKEVMARQGQVRFALLNVGANVSVDQGTLTALAYPVLSSVMEGIYDMPRASRGGQFAQAMTLLHKKAKTLDKYSILSNLSSIAVVINF